MARYTEYNGTQVDYDLDSKEPFTQSRQERFWEHQQNRERNKNNYEEEYDNSDWDD